VLIFEIIVITHWRLFFAVCCSEAYHNCYQVRAVGTATRLRAGRSGIRIPPGAKDASILKHVQIGFHPASYSLIIGVLSGWWWGVGGGVKRPWCETVHPPPSCDEVKNGWSCNSAPRHTPSWISRAKPCHYLYFSGKLRLSEDMKPFWKPIGKSFTPLIYFCKSIF
jgi:hypothetical protein